ncbi:MAG: error-prone DNA polymerase [Myxococcota bacterium]|jgi:error-prone DNA polymerase
MAYAELCARSCFSLLEGASQPAELVEAAQRSGIDHIAVVDRDCVYGVVQAHKAAAELGVHLVLGATVTVAECPPVTLLAQDHRGWSNLCRLLTVGRAGVPKGRSRASVSDLADHAGGLIALLHPGWCAPAAVPLRDAFEHVGALVSRTLRPVDVERVRRARALSSALDVPLVATNDAVVHSRERQQLADVLTCIRRRTTLMEAARSLAPNAERWLQSEAAFRARWADLPEAVEAASALAERCTFSLDELEYVYPREVVPEGFTAMAWLRREVEEGLVQRYGAALTPAVRRQVEHELEVIEELKFPSYFLTVYDIVRFARSRGILCQGRGSAANSAVCYALGITAVDPARASLLFERFISRERGEPPDIDVDFEHERREEVIQYIYDRYGRDRAALVNEFITYRGRSAIRDVGKVFGLSLDQVDRLAKSLDRWAAGAGVTTDELVREAGLDPESPVVQATLRCAGELKGFPRHLSIHVGGFVIAADKLVDLVPVEPASMVNRTVIQWDKYDVDALRFVKVDVLALGMLTAIRRAFDLVEGFTGLSLTLATVPAEDPAVYDMFCRADTVGVFQIESRAQMSMLPRLRPRCFYDLVIEVAIVRPGPIQGGMVHPYLRRRSGEEPVSYAHPALEPILERTLGVPLFQEQVMAMAVAVGGFTAGQADRLRRAMGAWRKRGNLQEMGRTLVAGMVSRGIEHEYAEQIFAQILGFGEYGFPESHAASFALLVYVSGWLRCHHLAAFTAALINSQPMGFYSPRALLADAKRHGVEVRPVCIVRSDWDCALEVGEGGAAAIRCGLRLVRSLSRDEADAVVAERTRLPFRGIADLARRTALNRGALQALAEADAFIELGVDRRKAAWVLQGLWTELPLFAGLDRREPAAVLPVETAVEALQADFRAVGLSVTTHPVELVRAQLDARRCRLLSSLASLEPGARVRIAGLVSSRQRPGTASGVVFMTLEDETAMANLVIWPRTWQRFRTLARSSSLLGADGVLQRQGEAVSVLVERFWQVPAPDDSPSLATLKVRSRDFH